MKHSLTASKCSTGDLVYETTILELDKDLVNISITMTDFINHERSNEICINLDKKELHSFIGTLLHVQSKMKGANNG